MCLARHQTIRFGVQDNGCPTRAGSGEVNRCSLGLSAGP